MFRFLARFRPLRTTGATSPGYEIVCLCNTRLKGVRARGPLSVRCPQCGRKNFVLPRSPLPAVAASEDEPGAAPPPVAASRWPRPWLLGLLCVFLLLAVGGGYGLLRHFAPGPGTAAGAREVLDRHRTRGQTALGDGNFQVAVGELRSALTVAERHPATLVPAEFRQLFQLHRQAEVLADLLHEPLSTLLQRAAGIPDEEWQVVFKRNYHAKSVVFDAAMRRRADGQYELNYVVWDGQMAARLQLEDVDLLHTLPLDQAQRLIFGVRLADVRREPSGRWLIHLLPNSGVLLTDQAAVEACLFLTADHALKEVLERQAEWMRERP